VEPLNRALSCQILSHTKLALGKPWLIWSAIYYYMNWSQAFATIKNGRRTIETVLRVSVDDGVDWAILPVGIQTLGETNHW